MNFFIQANNPRYGTSISGDDASLADAIESAFPLATESAIMFWNYIGVPLSYKYDISYMIDDVLKLLSNLQNQNHGRIMIRWLPDTFRCDWIIVWKEQRMVIESKWEHTMGHLEKVLNETPSISLSISEFVKEWKAILIILEKALTSCGYNEKSFYAMKQLVEQRRSIQGNGVLYI